MSVLQHLRDSLRKLFSPQGTPKVLEILHGLAMIDEELDERELNFLRAFAKRWGLQLDNALLVKRPAASAESNSFTLLRDAMQDYLAAKPPSDQARQLRDVMTALVTIDGKICSREEPILDELGRMIDAYVGNDSVGAYRVRINAADDSQRGASDASAPNTENATTIGAYHSRAYAELVANWYRDAGQLPRVEFREPAGESKTD